MQYVLMKLRVPSGFIECAHNPYRQWLGLFVSQLLDHLRAISPTTAHVLGGTQRFSLRIEPKCLRGLIIGVRSEQAVFGCQSSIGTSRSTGV
jgi:hypothetical protein